MHLTGTLSATTLPHVWTLLIHLFPWYYVVTSMLFLKEPKIVGALILLSPSVRALSHWSYFSRYFVFWMFGAISILIFALTPGWNPMVPCPPALTLLASCLSAFILCLPVLLFHVLSLIMMPFFSASLFLNCFLVALADENWMFPSPGIQSFFFFLFNFLATSGQDGGRVSPRFQLFNIDGTEARNISKVLRSAIVVVHIMNVLCRALSFLPLLVIWRAESNILDLVLITT